MGFEILYGVGGLLLLLALFWGSSQYRKRRQGETMVGDRKTRELYRSEDGQEGSSAAELKQQRGRGARRTGERQIEELQTEDEMARDSLGGVKGSPDLPPAPMTPQQDKNTPKRVDPGHPA